MVSFRQAKNIKSNHSIINKKCLLSLAKIKGIKKIIPGIINWRKKTSAVKAGLYFQRMTDNGLKLAIKANMYVQDIFVTVDSSFQLKNLKEVVLNPKKIN